MSLSVRHGFGCRLRCWPRLQPWDHHSYRFSQLSLGDSIFIWSDGATQFPIDEYTVRRNDNGKLYFDEPIDSTEWDSDQSSLRFRAAYVPTAVRVSIRVLNDEGLEPRTLSIMVHPYNAVR